MKKIAGIILFLGLMGFNEACANLLLNPGMEAGTSPTNITDWIRAGGSEFREEETAFGYTLGEGTFPDGDYAVKMFGGGSDLVQSNIVVIGGASYILSGNFYHSSTEDAIEVTNISTRIFLHIEYFDGVGSSLGHYYSDNHNGYSPADMWVPIIQTSAAPLTAASAAFHIETDSDVGGGSIFGDAFSFSQVPEPSVLATCLLAFGLLIGARRRFQ